MSNKEQKEELVIIGTIGRPRDVDGEMTIIPLTDIENRFTSLKSLFVVSKTTTEEKKILSVRYLNDVPVVRLEGIRSKEEAARYANKDLAIRKQDIAKLPDDRFYLFEIIGCQAVDGERVVGNVTNVEQYPANDVIYIEAPNGTIYSLAAVDAFVKKIDIANKRIEIDANGLVNNKV